jgi:hypothetical protein
MEHPMPDRSWPTAVSATLHCLTGCAVGEVLGMVLATWWGWPSWPSVALAFVLAFVFGYALTFSSVRRHGASVRAAIRVALAADTVSILVMELVDNGFIVLWPGAMAAGLADLLFWGSLAAALAIAFVVTVPVNRAMIARGRGHAAVHALHHGGGIGQHVDHEAGHTVGPDTAHRHARPARRR